MDYHKKYKNWKKKYLLLKKNVQYAGQAINKDLVYFWGRQMMEHAGLLFLGFDDPELKKNADNVQKKWKDFLDKIFYNKGIKVGPETVHLTSDDLQKADEIDIDELNRLVKLTTNFNQKAIDILKTGQWVGWIFLGIVEHMLMETKFFGRMLNGPMYTSEELIPFINNHHGTEMAATAQLINPDPKQQYLIDVIRSYALKNMSFLKTNGSMAGLPPENIPFPSKDWTLDDEQVLKGLSTDEQATYLIISLKYSKELTDFAKDSCQKIDDKELRSIIHPILAHHVHREFVWFTEMLEKIKS